MLSVAQINCRYILLVILETFWPGIEGIWQRTGLEIAEENDRHHNGNGKVSVLTLVRCSPGARMLQNLPVRQPCSSDTC